MENDALLRIGYIVAAALFIIGLKYMAHPRTAVRGNILGTLGMTLAIVIALLAVRSYVFVVIGGIVGGAIGATLALRVAMTAMPQLVALFNGLGGAASMFVAGGELLRRYGAAEHLPATTYDMLLATALTGMIGGVTFSGSLIACGKLQELAWFRQPTSLPGQQAINAVLVGLLVLLALLMTVYGVEHAGWYGLYLVIVLVAFGLGVLLVNPIGGADMPVVIALLNSYSGLAAAATGFVIDNNVLIISGSLVGATGLILTNLMCKAMNRSLYDVLFGVMGGVESVDVDELYATVRSSTADDVALILEAARRVIFVPGYGLAVAQAQHAVRNLASLLEERGVKVEYAIHPVAGRMPGHMNVLLAEADVPYEQMVEMDDINPTMETVDVAIVIGANDVVNPVARTDAGSPIAGMPIINVDQARTVIVIKRSLSPGFAGIANPLFAAENTLMLFGDAQKAVLDIVNALKES